MKLITIKLYLIFLIVVNLNLSAQWVNDPSLNTPVCVWESFQQRAEIVSDNRGGAIITWFDFRNGNADIFVQRLDSGGYQKWVIGGKTVCLNASNQLYHKIAKDGQGGCIVVWEDDRNGNIDIYAQRVDSSGNVVWDSAGVVICSFPLDQEDPQIISDGFGGAIILWENKQGAVGEIGLYAQRINSSGQVLWSQNGVPIATSPYSYAVQFKPKIAEDGTGGAIISYLDYTLGEYIYAQRVNSEGTTIWIPGGLPICITEEEKRFHNFICVNDGEFVLSWNTEVDYLLNDWDLRAQKIDTSGNIFWNPEGVVICPTAVSINPSAIAFDNTNAVIIGWEDHRIPGIGATIYCQKINLDGIIQWQQYGVPVSTLNVLQGFLRLICDSSGNSIACWLDARDISSWDIYAQKFNSSGTILWEPEGKPVSIGTGGKFYQHLILTTNEDYIVAWEDERNGNFDIYAQSLNTLITAIDNSEFKLPELFILEQNYPNPFNPSTKISWQSPVGSHQTLKIYDVLGNEIATLVDEYKPAGSYEVEFNSHSGEGRNLNSGVYFYQLKAENYIETKKMILLK